MADIPGEHVAAAPERAHRRRLPLRILPGVLAALLYFVLATREAVLGSAAAPAAVLLAVLLVAALVIQPPVARALRRLLAWPGLLHASAVAGIVAVGAGLRFWGLRFGLPYLDHPDEWAVADRALTMLQTADYNPHSFVYPSLYTYLQLGVAIAHFLWGASAGLYRTMDEIDKAHFYAWGRALTALLGSGTVLLTLLIGRRLYGRAAGLIGGLFLAVYPSAVGDAHYITTDTPSMFFTLLAFVAIARLGLGSPAPGSLPWLAGGAGVAAGLAVAAKYNVAVLVVPLLLAIIMRGAVEADRTGMGWRFAWPALSLVALALIGSIIGFTLGTPFWLADLPRVLNDIASVIVHYRFTGHAGAESTRPALFYWGAFVDQGALLAAAFLIGTLLAFIRHCRADLLILAFAGPYFLQMTAVRVVFFRNTMPLLPFLCLLAAALIVAAVEQLRWSLGAAGPGGEQRRAVRRLARSTPLLATLVALAVAQPLASSVRDDWLRARPTTRVLATEWIAQHAPDGTRIWLEDQTLILPSRLRVQGGKPVTSNALAWYREHGFRYLVVNDDAAGNDPAQLAQFGPPVVQFAPEQQRYGPRLSIYDTGRGDTSQDQRTPSGATLGGGAMVLDGYRHPREAQAGTVLPLALYWRVNRALPQDYTVFVHLLDQRSAKVAQRDMPPLDGSRPTSRWQPGELIRDDQDLVLPKELAPGTYRLVVGMYEAKTLAAINDSGPIAVGEVVVRGPGQ